jgi:hypothetical protein
MPLSLQYFNEISGIQPYFPPEKTVGKERIFISPLFIEISQIRGVVGIAEKVDHIKVI